MHVGRQIREARERRGITGADLAELANVSQSQVSLLERDQRPILTSSAAALLEALGLRVVLVPDEGEE